MSAHFAVLEIDLALMTCSWLQCRGKITQYTISVSRTQACLCDALLWEPAVSVSDLGTLL